MNNHDDNGKGAPAPARTKAAFLEAYERELRARWDWARDDAKLARFLASCEATLGGASMWNHNGESVTAAWRSIGGRGRPTLKALRALK